MVQPSAGPVFIHGSLCGHERLTFSVGYQSVQKPVQLNSAADLQIERGNINPSLAVQVILWCLLRFSNDTMIS